MRVEKRVFYLFPNCYLNSSEFVFNLTIDYTSHLVWERVLALAKYKYKRITYKSVIFNFISN